MSKSMASHRITFETILVTPELARDWLRHNTGNRNVRHKKVAQFARDMVNDKWLFTGEPIKFDYTGRLIDGQNRLYALIQADRTLRMVVARGLTPEAQGVMDTGATRSAADALKMVTDHGNPNILAAAIRMAIARETGLLKTSISSMPEVTHTEIVEYYQKHPEIADVINRAHRMAVGLQTSPTVVAYAMYATGQVDQAASEAFFDDLWSFRTTGHGDPRYTLLRRLERIRRRNEHIRAPQLLYYFLRAWNAYRDGVPLLSMKDVIKGTPTNIPDPR